VGSWQGGQLARVGNSPVRYVIAIPPSQICTHLKSHHSKIPASRRHDVADAAHTVSDLAWRAAGVRIRKPAGEAVASLGGVEVKTGSLKEGRLRPCGTARV
jgi:hypothetical protein